MDCRANPLMDRKVVGVVLFGVAAVVAVVTSLQFLDVVWCNAVVVGVAMVVVVVLVVVGLMLLKQQCCSCSS